MDVGQFHGIIFGDDLGQRELLGWVHVADCITPKISVIKQMLLDLDGLVGMRRAEAARDANGATRIVWAERRLHVCRGKWTCHSARNTFISAVDP